VAYRLLGLGNAKIMSQQAQAAEIYEAIKDLVAEDSSALVQTELLKKEKEFQELRT
jgi:hypothetical protein